MRSKHAVYPKNAVRIASGYIWRDVHVPKWAIFGYIWNENRNFGLSNSYPYLCRPVSTEYLVLLINLLFFAGSTVQQLHTLLALAEYHHFRRFNIICKRKLPWSPWCFVPHTQPGLVPSDPLNFCCEVLRKWCFQGQDGEPLTSIRWWTSRNSIIDTMMIPYQPNLLLWCVWTGYSKKLNLYELVVVYHIPIASFQLKSMPESLSQQKNWLICSCCGPTRGCLLGTWYKY